MPIKAGTVKDITGSMAEAIENALEQEYRLIKGKPIPDMGLEDRRLMLVAIAQGVVRYLKDNTDAFKITAEITPEGGASAVSCGHVTVDDIETIGDLYK